MLVCRPGQACRPCVQGYTAVWGLGPGNPYIQLYTGSSAAWTPLLAVVRPGPVLYSITGLVPVLYSITGQGCAHFLAKHGFYPILSLFQLFAEATKFRL